MLSYSLLFGGVAIAVVYRCLQGDPTKRRFAS